MPVLFSEGDVYESEEERDACVHLFHFAAFDGADARYLVYITDAR